MKRTSILLALTVGAVSSMAVAQGPTGTPPQFFGGATLLTDGVSNNEDPHLYVTGRDVVILTWMSERAGSGDIYAQTTIDGLSWKRPRVIVGGPEADFFPSLTRRKGWYHLTWFRIEPDTFKFRIYYSRSQRLFRDWSTPTALTDADGFGWVPSIVRRRRQIVIFWTSGISGNRDIFSMTSADNGDTWGEPFQITSSPLADDFANVIVDRGTFHLVWTRYDSSQGDYNENLTAEILYATSADGTTWSTPDSVTNNGQIDVLPTIHDHPRGERKRIAWASSYYGGSIVEVDAGTSGLGDQDRPRILSPSTYSARFATLADGRRMMVSVGESDPGRGDLYSLILD